jgi:hypothetical protein
MGARDWVDKNKRASTIASVVLLGAAAAFLYYQFRPQRPPITEWYTVDDGQTWFKDSNRKVPPFEHDGKQAVLAKVYQCHGQKFVAYLKRYKPEAKRRLDEFHAAEDTGKPTDGINISGTDWQAEYKRPGEKEWSSSLEKRAEVMDVKCPHGTKEDPLIVYP